MLSGTEPTVVGFTGPSGAGKTTLIAALLERWSRQGRRVGVVKHTHHVEPATDGRRDSDRLLAAGAAAVRVAPADEPWDAAVSDLAHACPGLDWIVCEGYRSAPVVQVLVEGLDERTGELPFRPGGWVVRRVRGALEADRLADWIESIAAPLAWPEASAAGRESAADAAGAAGATDAGSASGAASTPSPTPGGADRGVAGVVLAGGASRRMGRDKADMRWRGRTWLERVTGALERATGRPALVVGGSRDAPLAAPDIQPSRGPLAGFVSGAARVRTPYVLLAPCDMPFLTAEALSPILAERHRLDRGGGDAVVPRLGGRLQPLLALYSRRRMPDAIRCLAAGRGSMHAWLDGLRVVPVGEEAWTAMGMDPSLLLADADDEAAWGALLRRRERARSAVPGAGGESGKAMGGAAGRQFGGAGGAGNGRRED